VRGARGKAMFVRSLRALDADPADAAQRYANWGFTWAVVTVSAGQPGSSDTRHVNRHPAYFRELKKRAVTPWIMWGLPKPEDWQEEAQNLFAFADEAKPYGLVLNAEVEWKGVPPEQARAFVEAIKASCKARGMKLALTSYARPRFHRTFPWAAFAGVVDLAIPLTFDRDMSFAANYFSSAINEYRERGFATLVPGLGLWNHEADRTKTPDELTRYLDMVPATPGGVFWGPASYGVGATQIGERVLRVVAAWKPKPIVPLVAAFLLDRLPGGRQITDLIFGA